MCTPTNGTRSPNGRWSSANCSQCPPRCPCRTLRRWPRPSGAAQFQVALTNRAVIDQALGIIMSRTGATAEEAFDRLRIIGQKDNRKLSAVADATVAEAVRRARARHADD